MNEISLKAYAKINLGLDVLRRKENGYHEVSMIMQTIDLYDDLTMKKIEEDAIRIHTNWDYLATDETNLVYRAIQMMREEFHITSGVEVELHKVIPMAAGMAGGSSDCAAALKGMNELYELGLSLEQLKERGVKLGADVPYCLMGGTALAEGIGEELSAITPMKQCPILIAKPSIAVSTKWVYENLKLNDKTRHPDIRKQIADIERGDIEALCADMGNVLADVTEPEYPIITQIKEKMLSCGAIGSMMTGSGPTVFGIFSTEVEAQRAKNAIKAAELAKAVYVTSVYNG